MACCSCCCCKTSSPGSTADSGGSVRDSGGSVRDSGGSVRDSGGSVRDAGALRDDGLIVASSGPSNGSVRRPGRAHSEARRNDWPHPVAQSRLRPETADLFAPTAAIVTVFDRREAKPVRVVRGTGFRAAPPDPRDYSLPALASIASSRSGGAELEYHRRALDVVRKALRWMAKELDRQSQDGKRAGGKKLPLEALLDGEEAHLRDSCNLLESEWFSPVEDQGLLGSCAAQAVVALAEYTQFRQRGRRRDLSRSFLYKVARNLQGLRGDSGVDIRSALKALVAFGVPPEEWWPYDVEGFDDEPDAFTFGHARSFKGVTYARLDRGQGLGKDTLDWTRASLQSGCPVAFGFLMPDTIVDVEPRIDPRTGRFAVIPWTDPTRDRIAGAHAVLAVGYDDTVVTSGAMRAPSGKARGGDVLTKAGHGKHAEARGALLIRNSWGRNWGDDGHAWLPYEYVTQDYATDFWTLLQGEWLDL
jgi:C1A family cysteine protease